MFDEISRSIDELGNSLVGALNGIQGLFGRELSVAKPVKENVLQMIGNTPLIRLNQIGSHLEGIEFYLKAEFMNPTGSVKDRSALAMVMGSERRGKLSSGKTLLLTGSGTSVISLVWIANFRGYSIRTLVTESESEANIEMLEKFGSKVEKTSAGDESALMALALEMERSDPKLVYLNENINMANTNVHYMFTGPEIWRDLNGQVDAFVAGGGSGGTISGVGRFLKSKKSAIKVVMGAPEDSIYAKRFVEMEESVRLPDTFDSKIVDHYVPVERDQALRVESDLYKKEGIFAGYTTGMTLAGAIRFGESLLASAAPRIPGKIYRIVVLSPDRV